MGMRFDRTGLVASVAVLAALSAGACGSRPPAGEAPVATVAATTAVTGTTTAADPPGSATSATGAPPMPSVASTSTSTPPSTPASAAGAVLAACDEDVAFPVGPSSAYTGAQADAVPFALAVVNALDDHRDVLAGVQWDAATGTVVVLAVEAAEARRIVDRLWSPQAAYRVDVVRRSYGDLGAILTRIMPVVSRAKVAYSGQVRLDGRVQVDLAIREAAAVATTAAAAGEDTDAVCVHGGADPATVVRDGPQPAAGDGWRLLGAVRATVPGGSQAALAATAAAATALWDALQPRPDSPLPPVDPATEVVLAFSRSGSSSCPPRLDGVTFDRDGRVVRPVIVVPGGTRACTADAVPRTWVVAVPRDRLPPLPFRIVVWPEGCASGCDGQDALEVTALDR